MFQNQIIDTYFYFHNLLFLSQDNIIIIGLKLKLKILSFVLFLECLHECFKNEVLRIKMHFE